jgi:hypothetical protein
MWKDRDQKWQALYAGGLLLLTAMLYAIYYAFFPDPQRILGDFLGYTAFLPVQVLLGTLIIGKILDERQKRVLIEKLTMVIGAFYSEVGMRLLKVAAKSDPTVSEMARVLHPTGLWKDKDWTQASKRLATFKYAIPGSEVDWPSLKQLMEQKMDFLLRLLENPNLLEHESFTGLLRASLHLAEELDFRESFDALPKADVDHLALDLRRVYVSLVSHWLDYMRYMQKNYPYLFSLAVRTNPLDTEASAVIRE